MPNPDCYQEALKAAIESGQVSMDLVNTAVSRHLQKKFELGLFENPYVNEGLILEVFETPAQRSLARQIASQSMVLLANDGLLPLKKTIGTLAVIGPNAHAWRNLVGDYSYAAQLEGMLASPLPDSPFVGVDPAALAGQAARR